MPRPCYVLRVFTRRGEGGNPLGVVTDVTGLGARTMQRIAADLNFSETVFLDWRDTEHPSVRIFTPTTELTFAGHPLVGTAWLLNTLGPGGPGHLRCPAVEVVTMTDQDGDCWIDAPLSWPVTSASAFGWPAAIATHFVEMSHPYLLVELPDPGQVAAVQTTEYGWTYLYSWEGPNTIKARFFAAGGGIEEDAATGSAAVALAALWTWQGRDQGAIEINQGDEMGRPSTIRLRWGAGRSAIGGAVVKDEVRWLDV